MAFQVVCRCGARFAAEEHLSGSIVPCPSCRQPLSILSPTAAAGVAYAPAPVQPASHPVPSSAEESSQRFLFIVGGVGAAAVVTLLAALIASSLLSSKENEPLATGQPSVSAGGVGGAPPTSPASPSSSANAKAPAATGTISSALGNELNDRIGSPGFATPEDAYVALRGAVRAHDWGKVYDCLVDEYRDRLLAGRTVFLIIEAKTNPESAAMLARHGISESKVQAAQLSGAGTKTIGITPNQIAAMRNIADDPRAFFIDVLEVQYQEAREEREMNPKNSRFVEDGLIDVERLEDFRDLKITGKRAVGRMRGPNAVLFEQTARGWLVLQVSTVWMR